MQRIPRLYSSWPRNRRGISLVELLVVLAIILLVMGMIVAVLSKVYKVIESWRS